MTSRHAHPPVGPRRLAVAPDPAAAPVAGPDELVERLVAMAADVARLRHREVDRVLGATAALALESVPGTAHAGVLRWLPTGALTAAAPSGEVAGRLDGSQVALAEGPGCDALHLLGASLPGRPTDPGEPTAPREVDAPDLRPAAAAARRWPRFAMEASRLDVAAVVALPLHVDPAASSRRTAARRPLHVLNLYAHATEAFGPHARVLARALAAHAAVALSAAQDAERIEEALRSRDTIGQAKGILMQRHGLDADGAFARLVAASQYANLRLRDVAAWLVDENGSATPR